MRTIDHWINGHLVNATSGRTGPVYNPATGQQQAEVGMASESDVDAAVAAAKAAFPAWRATSLSRRAEVMFAFRGLVVSHRDEIAELVSIEHGKVPSDAAGELARGIENIEFACGIPAMLKGGYSEGVSGGVDVYSIKQPLGVVAGITPFNFPAMVPMWMFANAIATGNTFVLKPSEKDPSVALLLADLLQQAGLPDGVFNVIHGDKTAVDRILAHPDVEAVSFVGSTPIAQYIYATGTANGKRVQALGGAKNHMVVLPDADINMAADAAVSAAYGSAGERCMAISVVVAVGGVGDRLIDAITERLPKLKVGPGTDPSAEMGPLITGEHRDRVAGYLAAAPGEGATVVVDGRDADLPSDGFFLGVSLIDNVQPGMSSYDDEIFGPVLSVVRVDTYDEAVDLVNGHRYGNGTAIFTRDGGAATRFQHDIKVGMVGINVPIPVPVAYYSFGGWKASIFGDSNIYGPAGVDFYTRTKTVTSRWPDPATSSVDLGFPRTRWLPREERRHMDIGVVLQCTPPAARVVDLAKRAETYGFRYVWTFDSHILWEEPYVIFSKILDETRKVIVGPMVTNPATRDITVTASVFATLNEMYGNRTVIGIGRGDSAVRVTNGKPVTVAELRQAVVDIKGLVNGEAIEYKGNHLRLPWAGDSRTDVWVAAYGPKVLAVAGEVGDGFILQLADASIAEWTIAAVRAAAVSAGRSTDDVYVCVAAPAYVTDGSPEAHSHARDQLRWFGGMVGNHVADIVARYGENGGAVPQALTDYIKNRQGYDYNEHGQAGNTHTDFVPDEIVDRFCIIGPPEEHIRRLEELKALGVNQFALYLQHDDKDQTLAAYGEKIVPAVQEHLRATS